MTSTKDIHSPENWKTRTPEEPGFHTVITPENSACRSLWFFRLNLEEGTSYTLQKADLELSAVVTGGRVTLAGDGKKETLSQFDSFYLPGKQEATLTATEKAILYIGGAVYEGVGRFLVRKYDPTLPLGEIRQVHGEPPHRRDVFQTLNEETPASRLITGLTWGEDGKWTSWPPHQHEADLEEAYCYFDIPAPKFALHLSYTHLGVIEAIHPVSSGDCIAVPRGYHPTVAIPGVRSSYFWVMAAHSHASRRYDLAVPDPELV